MRPFNLRLISFFRSLGVTILAASISLQSSAQASQNINLPAYDLKPIHYGFLVGIHSSIYKLKYSEAFTLNPDLHSIMPSNSAGFSLGFVGNLRLHDQLDFRITPAVGFYELKVDYNFISKPTQVQAISSTNVELPALFKYKSVRRGNTRMFLIAGAKYSIEASGKKEDDEAAERLLVRDSNVFAEFGFGIDLYYPLFKFSPEIRFSKGLLDLKQSQMNAVSVPIQSLHQNVVTVYLIVQ